MQEAGGPPRVNQIVLVPHRGHSDNDGKFDRGWDIGKISEYDVLGTLVQEMTRYLEDWGLRYYTVENSRHPGVKYSERPSRVEPFSMVLDLRCGWYKTVRTRNMSSVFYGAKYAELLAERFQEALTEFGVCSSYGHRVSIPKLETDNPIITGDNCHGIRIEVFSLNGPEIDSYLRRMSVLARDLVSVVVDYLRGRGSAGGAGRGVYLR